MSLTTPKAIRIAENLSSGFEKVTGEYRSLRLVTAMRPEDPYAVPRESDECEGIVEYYGPLIRGRYHDPNSTAAINEFLHVRIR
ncbi:hypothetical protein Enr13x_05050 [Stieleria neptunia]|uniref:Uncharacterized protein n=1 Tax=Stieleria neptunia TaxID=2527979 RepID=A0A518HIJ5_9BACT|nr:hypothetical protein Enr13x_05050 [Stieleria neptunia]